MKKISTIFLAFVVVIILLFSACKNDTDTPFDPDPKPDPKIKILYASKESGDYNIYIMDIDGGNKIQLTDDYGSGPAISPDKAKIAYTIHVSTPTVSAAIGLMDIDGSNKKRLTYKNSGSPAWAPDGDYIYYDTSGEIWKIKSDGTNDTKILSASKANGSQISHDNLYIYFNSDPNWTPNDTINRADIDGSNLTNILESDGVADYALGTRRLNSDSTKMLLSTSENGAGYNDPLNIYELDISGSSKTPIFTRSGNESYKCGAYYSSDTKIIFIYSADYTVSDSYDIWIADSDGSNMTQITNNGYDELYPIIIE
ncbi:hypothetical protein KAU32_12585 [bacterium]|nr:hypothetical protein [bacterium]